MMWAWFQAKHFTIDHVANPSQRMPVCAIAGRKSPFKICTAQSIFYVLILGNIYLVVIINKVIFCKLDINSKGKGGD